MNQGKINDDKNISHIDCCHKQQKTHLLVVQYKGDEINRGESEHHSKHSNIAQDLLGLAVQFVIEGLLERSVYSEIAAHQFYGEGHVDQRYQKHVQHSVDRILLEEISIQDQQANEKEKKHYIIEDHFDSDAIYGLLQLSF